MKKIKKRKMKVTIGIPAYNEEANVKKLLLSILKQRQEMFRIEKIIVLSDGSSDKTAEKVREVKDKRIELVENTRRLGKPLRENQIFSMVESEVLVMLDADITILSNFLIEQLVSPFLKKSSIMLTSGKALALKPKTIIQHIFYAGAQIWEDARDSVISNDLYFCEGEIRAFKKKLYKEIKFPSSSAEDVYPYLYCVEKKYDFESIKNAVVYYRLPRTFRDYLKQINRYWKSKHIHEENFSKKFVDPLYTIDFKVKALSAIKNIFKNPIWTITYILFLLIPKLVFFVTPQKTSSVWEVSSSTKYN